MKVSSWSPWSLDGCACPPVGKRTSEPLAELPASLPKTGQVGVRCDPHWRIQDFEKGGSALIYNGGLGLCPQWGPGAKSKSPEAERIFIINA